MDIIPSCAQCLILIGFSWCEESHLPSVGCPSVWAWKQLKGAGCRGGVCGMASLCLWSLMHMIYKHPVCFEGSFLVPWMQILVLNSSVVATEGAGHSGSLQTLGMVFLWSLPVLGGYFHLMWFFLIFILNFFFWLQVCKEWCPFTCCALRLYIPHKLFVNDFGISLADRQILCKHITQPCKAQALGS